MLRSMLRAAARRAPVLNDARAALGVVLRHRPRPMLCPCCGRTSKFRLFGLPPRLNALCPNCRSLERHRFLMLHLKANPNLIEGKAVLHFAPEEVIEAHLKKAAARYVGCDLNPRPGHVAIDIENMDLPDAGFDLILCSHVLEHVDDRKALAELRRVLKPGGTLLLMFPLIEGWPTTYENASVSTPEGRLRHFGQEDHVRYFGADARDRIRAAGFELSELTASEPEVGDYGLNRGEKIFVCR